MLRENSADYHFQPIFSAHTGRVAAYEALMRGENAASEFAADRDEAGAQSWTSCTRLSG